MYNIWILIFILYLGTFWKLWITWKSSTFCWLKCAVRNIEFSVIGMMAHCNCNHAISVHDFSLFFLFMHTMFFSLWLYCQFDSVNFMECALAIYLDRTVSNAGGVFEFNKNINPPSQYLDSCTGSFLPGAYW